MNKTKVSSVYGKCGDFTSWKVDIMCRLIDSGKFTRDETAEIISAIQAAENNKKRDGYWIRHGSENYETYECSNCGNLLIPEMLHESEPTFEPCKYKKIYIQAYHFCYMCGYKMEGVRNYSLHSKEWSLKFDD